MPLLLGAVAAAVIVAGYFAVTFMIHLVSAHLALTLGACAAAAPLSWLFSRLARRVMRRLLIVGYSPKGAAEPEPEPQLPRPALALEMPYREQVAFTVLSGVLEDEHPLPLCYLDTCDLEVAQAWMVEVTVEGGITEEHAFCSHDCLQKWRARDEADGLFRAAPA